MILADYADTGYNIVLLLHIIAVIVALAPVVVHPVLFGLERRRSDGDIVALAGRVTGLPTRIYTIALVVAGVLGIGLISMGDPVTEWGDTWIWLSLILWIALNGVLHAVMLPSERALAGGDRTVVAKLDKVGPALIVLVLVILYLMVLKPGAPSGI
jgi:uncharacterized membrane protein